jgi:hypothetical protein
MLISTPLIRPANKSLVPSTTLEGSSLAISDTILPVAGIVKFQVSTLNRPAILLPLASDNVLLPHLA